MIESHSSAVERKVDELERRLGLTEGIVNSWSGAGGDPYFRYFKGAQGSFDYLPLGSLRLESSIAQATNTGVQTALQFNGSTFRSAPDPAIWSSVAGATSEIRLVGVPFEHIYLLTGHIQFSSNSSGRRSVSINWVFPSTTYGDTPISVSAASGTEITGVNFSLLTSGKRSVSGPAGDNPQYLRIDAVQDSGGSLNVIYCTLSIFRIY